jgi:dipeptidyl aminopeptidase/acylaminoacyl peptidase
VSAAGAAPTRAVQPYGSWPTPITSELVVRASVGLGGVAVDGDSVWWSEQRPEEGGRTVLVRDGVDVLPPPWNARTAVHEYGGGAWWVRDGVAWFVEWTDQRLYRVVPGEEPAALTPEPAVERGDRWADGDVSPDGHWILCVRERHDPYDREATNSIVLLRAHEPSDSEVVTSGHDFYSDPRWAPDGSARAYLSWDHPDMPWDHTNLAAAFDTRVVSVAASDKPQSISQPRWGPDGWLYFISDGTGWWNLYRWREPEGVEPVVELDAEIGVPQWVFGLSRYDVLTPSDGHASRTPAVVVAYQRDGLDRLAVARGGKLHDLDVPYTAIGSVTAAGSDVVLVGASPTEEPAVVRVAIGERDGEITTGETTVLRLPRDLGLDRSWFSVPEPIDFTSAGGRVAHALHYGPASATHEGPRDERPPLLVFIHGGPTSAARPMLQLGVQYWTSRGFAVVDVNYGGSTGYGRAYRELLERAWGIVDVEDCEAAAHYLAERGDADADRLCIRGGSAGGYTTLAALAFRDTFAAGASHYGVADLEALAKETHKFESRYLDRLVGPYPQERDVYVERSPIHHVDGFDRPLIVLQGLEDEVVPPNQAEMIVAALDAKGVPVAYVAFEGEQHGFRQAPNIRRALDSELSFYAQVLGFSVPENEGIEPVAVRNLSTGS